MASRDAGEGGAHFPTTEIHLRGPRDGTNHVLIDSSVIVGARLGREHKDYPFQFMIHRLDWAHFHIVALKLEITPLKLQNHVKKIYFR